MIFTKRFFFLIIIIFTFGKNINSQDCPSAEASITLEGNHLRASISVDGALFNDFQGIGFGQITPPGLPDISVIFSSGLWLAAKDGNNNLKLTAATYGNNNDFVAGPIFNDNGELSFDCENFNRLWTVYGSEILQHNDDFEDNGMIDDPIENIYAYPAQGNPFFENIHGFSLPNTPQGLASFFDKNNDGVYNPDNGDFPLPSAVSETTIPSQIVWGIFNDAGAPFSSIQDAPLNTEIQITAWAMDCSDNELLNNTIFTSHKIINRGNEDLDSLRIGLFLDFDIGCFTDDFFGSAPDLNTFYGYNADELDGTTGCTCHLGLPTFCDNPPAPSITFLNNDMNSFMYYSNSSNSTDSILNAPTMAAHYYNLMNSKWKDGSPLTFGDNGIQGTQPTQFAFPNNPNDPTGWSMNTADPLEGDRRSIASTFHGEFEIGDVVNFDLAFTFHQDATLNHLEIVNSVYDNIPFIQQAYDLNFVDNCSPDLCFTDCVWAGDADQDSIVTSCDVLQIGLAFGEVGPSRNSPVHWFPRNGEAWNNSINGVDLKHADCSANGEIDWLDFSPIHQFFDFSYKKNELLDTYKYGPEMSLELVPIANSIVKKIVVNLNQQEEIYGLAYTIEYDSEFLRPMIILVDDPWENPNVDDYNFEKKLDEKGELVFASVKLDGLNSLTVTGKINEIRFAEIPTDYELVQTLIKIKNIKAINNLGETLDYGSTNLVIEITNPNGTGVILNNDNLEATNIQVFPNPAPNFLNIKIENPSSAHIVIFDIYGKKVLERMEVANSKIQLPISEFSEGVYFLKIEMEGKKYMKKFIKL